MLNKNIIRIFLGTALLLLIPLVGNWPWTLSDFVFAGVLLFGTGLAFELIARRSSNTVYRFAVGTAVITAFLLVWVNAAVGIIGDDNPANLLYGAVLLILIIGAVIARLRPQGMSRTLFTAAIAQMMVPVIALIFWNSDFAPGVFGVFVLNAFFAGAWIVSALLFRHAGATSKEATLQ